MLSLPIFKLAAAGVAVGVFLSSVANAQTGGPPGPGGPGGFGNQRVTSGSSFGAGSAMRLASIPEVQKALKLSAKKKQDIVRINREFQDGLRLLFQTGVGGRGIPQLNEDAATKLAEVLSYEQQTRLRGITIQILGASAVLVDAELAKELEISDEQRTKLEEVQQTNMQAMSDAFRASCVPAERDREKFEELHAAAEKRSLDVLTPEQQKQLEEMKGKKVKVDIMKLQGGGGGMRE